MSIIMGQPGCEIAKSGSAAPIADALTGALGTEKQITRGPGGRILTNTGVWSPDSAWLVYDTRGDAAGDGFNGATIEIVNIHTGEVREVYRASNGAHCGVVTFHPHQNKVVFILGPENPTPDWQYGMYHRQGVIVEIPLDKTLRSSTNLSPTPINLDARDITPPFTAGALRGGSHVHVWDAAGQWVSFTYEDHVMAQFKNATSTNDINLRNVGVSVPVGPVHVKKDHPRNHDSHYFSVLATRTTANPKPGSDEIKKAFEDGWVGTNGYLRVNGSRQVHALAFQGHVITNDGETIAEVFIADLPDDVTQPGDGALAGTETRLPFPPKGYSQRRLTFTTQRKFPGIQGPRHWLRSSPDGSRIAFLMKEDAGIVQLWTVSPNGGPPTQVTRNPWSITSAFTWSPDGRRVTYVMDNSVCVTEVASGKTERVTARTDNVTTPRSEACVFSPDGKKIAYLRRLTQAGQAANQIFVVFLEK